MSTASVGTNTLLECLLRLPRHWRWPACPESVARARKAVGESLPDFLSRHAPDGVQGGGVASEREAELIDVFSLITSELVTNAVTHAPTYERVVEVTLWRADGMVWLAVSDCGDVFPVRRRGAADLLAPVFPDVEDDHGRGLYLVDALADYRTVVPRPTLGKSVVAGLRLP